eukprot:TRINITY_DN10470_c0_g1_i3.p1 TRINITY_DN10470_c0_g1~~TRINITY_DN10470_c0_g1_i3.p1  ORF type:complete len:401 (+),score=76.59 TRINITY_DN10470_c0_g1_i3:51-1253(+)
MTRKKKPSLVLPVYGLFSTEFAVHRKEILKHLIVCFINWTLMISFLTLDWAVSYRQYTTVTIAIVDLDGTIIGRTILDEFKFNHDANEMAQILIVDNDTSSTMFPNGSEDVFSAVMGEQFWGAVVVNSNASSLLHEAYWIGNATYDSSGATFIIYNEMRSSETTHHCIVPLLVPMMKHALMKINSILAADFLKQLRNDDTGALMRNAQIAPHIVGHPIGASLFNVNPLHDNTPAVAVLEVGLIYFIILSFQIITIVEAAHVHGLYLKKRIYFIYRIALPFIMYFFLSLFYSSLALIFQVRFDNANDFVLYWTVNYFTMLASGLTLEIFNNFIGEPWLATFLDLWIVTNFTTSIFPLNSSLPFYRFGYAWPFPNSVIFKLKFKLNFGVSNFQGECQSIIRS